MLAPVMALLGKGGRAVVTNMHPMTEVDVRLSMLDLLAYEKEIVGCMYGSANPRNDIPGLLRLYQLGLLDIDSMITRTYKLEEINEAFQDLEEGRAIRTVLLME